MGRIIVDTENLRSGAGEFTTNQYELESQLRYLQNASNSAGNLYDGQLASQVGRITASASQSGNQFTNKFGQLSQFLQRKAAGFEAVDAENGMSFSNSGLDQFAVDLGASPIMSSSAQLNLLASNNAKSLWGLGNIFNEAKSNLFQWIFGLIFKPTVDPEINQDYGAISISTRSKFRTSPSTANSQNIIPKVILFGSYQVVAEPQIADGWKWYKVKVETVEGVKEGWVAYERVSTNQKDSANGTQPKPPSDIDKGVVWTDHKVEAKMTIEGGYPSTLNAYFPTYGNGKLHPGVDIGRVNNVTLPNPEIKAFGPGVVIDVMDAGGSGLGKSVKVWHKLEDGTDVYTVYGHLNQVDVIEGQIVGANSTLGRMGNTGHVIPSSGGDGTHLHFEILKKENPSYDCYGHKPSDIINPSNSNQTYLEKMQQDFYNPADYLNGGLNFKVPEARKE